MNRYRADFASLRRRGCYAVLLLALHLLQNTPGLLPHPFGAQAFLLIPAVVCIGMGEREFSGLLFGLFAGLLWDSSLFSGNWNAIYLCIIGMVCGALVQYLMRNNIMTASLLSALALLFYSLLHWLGTIDPQQFGASLRRLWTFYLPSCLFSLLCTAFLHFAVRAIATRFPARRAEEEQ